MGIEMRYNIGRPSATAISSCCRSLLAEDVDNLLFIGDRRSECGDGKRARQLPRQPNRHAP